MALLALAEEHGRSLHGETLEAIYDYLTKQGKQVKRPTRQVYKRLHSPAEKTQPEQEAPG